MLKKNKIDELKQIYELFSKVPENFEHIACQFKKYIQETGEAYEQNLPKALGF